MISPRPHFRNLCLVLLLLSLTACVAFGAEPKHVMLIHSFGRDFAPFNSFSAVLRNELVSRYSGSLDILEVSLESARSGDAVQEGFLVDYLAAQSSVRRLDLVIPIGGPAVRFAQLHRERFFSGTPMLISGTDQRHAQPAALTADDSVVAGRIQPARVVETILQLLPETKNIVVVIGSSPLEKFWLNEIRTDCQRFADRVSFQSLDELSSAEMFEHCARLPPRSAVFYAALVVDAKGIPQWDEGALNQLHEVTNAPVFGVFESQLGRGIVGGPLVDMEEMARNTAKVATRILHGEAAGGIRTAPQEMGVPQFDWRELQRWKISEARLPAGSVVCFRQPGLWERHGPLIFGGLFVGAAQAALIVGLVVNRTRRRRGEAARLESEARLASAVEVADLGFYDMGSNPGQVFVDDRLSSLLGLTQQDSHRVQEFWMEHIHPEDRDRVQELSRKVLGGELEATTVEYRYQHPQRGTLWFSHVSRLVKHVPAGHAARRLGVIRDITELKRSEEALRTFSARLISSQEAERARLARELHDDITQRLARLAIDVGSSEAGTSDRSPAETARSVREELIRLGEDVHALSYRLHPSILEDLGLPAALRAEAERFERQTAGVIELKVRALPDSVSPDVALCLFRIAQEALRNAARHSGARAIKLSLLGLDGGLQLAVQDDGCGFDPAVQRDQPSLGLSSMRERVRLLGGELEIESAPNQGTTVLAWVPLRKAEG